MESTLMQYPPGDPRMIDTIVNQLKSQGIFDQFRKECIADVDTKPAYQNLHQRVEGTVSGFLAHQVWRPDLNKNQLRESLRKHIHESGFLDMGVERIVDQVVNPKIVSVLVPQVEDVVYKFIGIDKPKKSTDFIHTFPPPQYQNHHIDASDHKKDISITDLLPKDLDPISPESDEMKKSDASVEDGELNDKIIEDEESPPFEPIVENNDNSVGSHLSGISGLTSPDDQHSNISYNGGKTPPQPAPLGINNDSQLSKVSSGSHLSFNSGVEEKPIQSTEQFSPMNIESYDSNSKTSLVESSAEVVERFEAAHIYSDTSRSSDDQRKVTTTTDMVDMDTDSDSSSTSDSDDSDRPAPSPGLITGEEIPVVIPTDKAAEWKVDDDIDSGNANSVMDAVPILDESINEKKQYRNNDKPLITVVKDRREPSAQEKEERKSVKKESKDDVKSTKDIAKDDENLIKKEREGKKLIRSEKDEVVSIKKHKESDKLVQKDKKDVKVEEKGREKKDVSVDAAKKSEKGKDGKNHVKVEKSVKRDDKDKKSSKTEGSKEESRVDKEKSIRKPEEKDKSTKKSEEKEKSVKKDEKEHRSSKIEEKRKTDPKSHDSKRKESSSSHTSHKSDKDKYHSSKTKKHEDGDKIPKTDKHGTKDDKPKKDEKPRSDDKQKPKNGKMDKEKTSKVDEKSSKDRDRKIKDDVSAKSESNKSDRERKDSKSKSSGDKHKDSTKKKEKSRLIDDHDKHREKRSEDRRSTDRDSNGTTRDRSASSSHTTSSGSKDAQRHETKDSKKSGKSGSGGNGGNNEASETAPKESKSNEVPSSSKKRPRENQEDVNEEYFCTSNEGKLTLKIKKPKIAANIFEVQKIIELRRSLAKLEVKRQQELSEAQKLSEEVDRETLAKTEKSAPDEIHPGTPKKQTVSESDDEVEDLRYFESYDETKSLDFIAYIKRLGQSRTLSEIDVSSVSSNDLEDISDSELRDEDYMPPSYALFPFPTIEYLPFSSSTIDSTIDAVIKGMSSEPTTYKIEHLSTFDSEQHGLPKLAIPKLIPGTTYRSETYTSSKTSTNHVSPIDNIICPVVGEIPECSDKKCNNTNTMVTDTTYAEMKPPQISPSLSEKRETRRSRKPNTKYSSDDYSFVSEDVDGEEPEVASHANKRRSMGLQGKGPTIKRQKLFSTESPDISSIDLVDNNNRDENIDGNTAVNEVPMKEIRLSTARRVGLSRPKSAVTQLARVSTPDFVMPLSPESDVSASSSELAKKSLLEHPSPSTSEEEVSVATVTDEVKRGQRRGVVATLKGQRYSSDDLYKPRPLFNRATRRKRDSSPTSTLGAAVNGTSVSNVVPTDTNDTQQLPRRQR